MVKKLTTKNRIKMEETIKTKKCSRCNRELPVTEFHKNSRTKDGLLSVCKSCRSATRLNEGQDPRLASFTPRQLMIELRARGYDGTLTFTKTIKLKTL